MIVGEEIQNIFYFSFAGRTVNCSDDDDWISCGCFCGLLGRNFEDGWEQKKESKRDVTYSYDKKCSQIEENSSCKLSCQGDYNLQK